VAESTFKIIKTKFVKGRIFSSLEQLLLEFADYVNWYSNCRIHSSSSCMTPVEFRKAAIKKAAWIYIDLSRGRFTSAYVHTPVFFHSQFPHISLYSNQASVPFLLICIFLINKKVTVSLPCFYILIMKSICFERNGKKAPCKMHTQFCRRHIYM
jgi:hypothetical protein